MDIWKWVQDIGPELRKAGHGRLADLIRRLPAETVDDHHDRVDALAPEAVALARAAGLPWVEVFLRHWHLQSRVLHRSQGDMALGEAVALVEFSHGDAARGCPQAVCTVQDLAACYAQVDGPGYAPERADVSRETLARIDPTWPCFTCISTEHAAALREGGDPQAALDFLDAQQRALAAAGQASERYSLLPERIQVLFDLGRDADALVAVDDAIANGRRDESQRRARKIDRARALARLGRGDEALRELPDLKDILPTPSYFDPYTDALARLVDLGARPNDGALGRLLQRFIAHLERQGCRRLPFTIAATAARLACDRGAPPIARLHLAAMERLLPTLNRPCGAPEQLEALRARIAAATTRDLPPQLDDPAYAILAHNGCDPEDAFLASEAHLAEAPDDPARLRDRARQLVGLGFGREATEQLEASLERNLLDPGTLHALTEAYVQAGRLDRHRALCERLIADDATRAIGHFLAARQLARDGEHAASDTHLHALLAERPDDPAALALLADNARARADWPALLDATDRLVDLGAKPGPRDWDRMLAATLLGAWDKVRASAARLGMTIDGTTEPIDETWEPCLVRVEHPSGRRQDLYARRTGPVTARLLQISRVDQPQRLLDVVAFDARPLNDPKKDDPDERPIYLYAEVAPLRRGGHTAFAIDGVHPGKDVLTTLRAALTRSGGALQVQSGERYRVTAPDGAEHPGVFAYVAFAPGADLAAASAALHDVARAQPHPLVWTELAEAAGDDALAEQHRAVARAWSLV